MVHDDANKSSNQNQDTQSHEKHFLYPQSTSPFTYYLLNYVLSGFAARSFPCDFIKPQKFYEDLAK